MRFGGNIKAKNNLKDLVMYCGMKIWKQANLLRNLKEY